ncbi:MAG: hypothetical protein KDM81_02775, partial [Verrucomicrobiae bacterium]|nr:hypothetical protein [Verrucomicrobiae bacterium]
PNPTMWGLAHAAAVGAAVGGGLLFSLLTRQTGAALWLGALAPVALWASLDLGISLWGPVSRSWRVEHGFLLGWLWGGLGILYGIVTCGLARRRFLVMEDLPAWGGALHWPGRDRQPTPGRRPVSYGGTPKAIRRVLRRKEWRLQQLNWIMAGCLCALTVIVALSIRAWDTKSDLAWFLPLLLLVWGLVPLMIGATAVAEERQLGVLATQQVLPSATGCQWWLKVRQSFLMGFLLGVVLPILLTLVLNWISADSGAGEDLVVRDDSRWPRMWQAWFFLPFAELGLPLSLGTLWLIATPVGLYASSLARNLFQALAITVGLGVSLSAAAVGARQAWLWWGAPDQPPYLLAALVVPGFLIPTLLWLGGRNYRGNLPARRVVRLNGVALPGALLVALTVTAGTYCRVWEAWLPRDIGPAIPVTAEVLPRLLTSSEPVPYGSTNLVPDPATIVGLLPDGRIRVHTADWLRPWISLPDDSGQFPSPETRLLPGAGPWRDVAVCSGTVFSIRNDGTLWGWGWRWAMTNISSDDLFVLPRLTEEPPDPQVWRRWVGNRVAAPPGLYLTRYLNAALFRKDGARPQSDTPRPPMMIRVLPEEQPWQVGSATNWTALHGSEGDVTALRSDGTAWSWGFDLRLPPRSEGYPVVHPDPVQIGVGTNWVGLSRSPRDWAHLISADGVVQPWPHYASYSGPRKPPQGLPTGRVVDLVPWGLWNFGVLRDDGRLYWRVRARLPGEDGPFDEVGMDARWRNADVVGTSLAAVRGDGALWRWCWNITGWSRNEETRLLGQERLAPGTDWLAVAQLDWKGKLAALSADGKVWRFGHPGGWERYQDERLRLLRISKRPKLVVDFAKTNGPPQP